MITVVFCNNEGLVIVVHALDCLPPSILTHFTLIEQTQVVAAGAFDCKKVPSYGSAYYARTTR